MAKGKNSELSSISYNILVALGEGQKHGYAVMQEIAARSGGRVQVLPGTLYSTIKKMLVDGLIEECGPPDNEAVADQRRRYYRITARGRQVASEETERMAMLVRIARRKGFA